jgi:small GTP-binding protein
MEEWPADSHYKVVMLGDSGVGKTALVNRITDGIFQEMRVPTVGSQFISLPLEFRGNKMTLELWDTAGHEVYRSLVGFYTRDAKGAFLVFDVTQEKTFNNLPGWIRFACDQAPTIQIILFANKIDLSADRTVPTESIRRFAANQKVEFMEGSAKTGENAVDLFARMGELMWDVQANATDGIKLQKGSKKRNKACC